MPVLYLPPMKKPQRVFVYELSEHYHFSCRSIDAEPKRSVVINKQTDSVIPARLLTQYYDDRSWMSLP